MQDRCLDVKNSFAELSPETRFNRSFLATTCLLGLDIRRSLPLKQRMELGTWAIKYSELHVNCEDALRQMTEGVESPSSDLLTDLEASLEEAIQISPACAMIILDPLKVGLSVR